MSRAEWNDVRVVLLDIEGTTTPIDFVYKKLFPYASSNVEPFLVVRSAEQDIRTLVRRLKEQHSQDSAAGLGPPIWPSDSRDEVQACVDYVKWLVARDSKCAPLKDLQGKIWQQGFESGELRGEVYADVPPAFARWSRQGRKIAIYSSGSVLAQKLLFSTVASGDLTHQIATFFDTAVGVKAEPQSYTKIAAAMARSTHEFLFLSDAQKEVNAARSAGMFAALCDRNAEGALASNTNPGDTIMNFDEVLPD